MIPYQGDKWGLELGSNKVRRPAKLFNIHPHHEHYRGPIDRCGKLPAFRHTPDPLCTLQAMSAFQHLTATPRPARSKRPMGDRTIGNGGPLAGIVLKMIGPSYTTMKTINIWRICFKTAWVFFGLYPNLAFGGNLSPNGEVEIKLLSLEYRFPDGRIWARCGNDDSLEELTIEWKGKVTSVAPSELKGISHADLQSLQLSTPIPTPPERATKGAFERDHCIVTIAYGDPIVTESMRHTKRHVRFEFFKGIYSDRFTAVPEKSGKKWKIFYKDKDKIEEEYGEHDGVLQPWSLIRDRERDSEYMEMDRKKGADGK